MINQHDTGANTAEQAAPDSPPCLQTPPNIHPVLALNPVILFVRILLNRFIGLLGEEGLERQRGGLGSLSQSEEPGLEGEEQIPGSALRKAIVRAENPHKRNSLKLLQRRVALWIRN